MLIVDLPGTDPVALAQLRAISARAGSLAILALIGADAFASCGEVFAAGADEVMPNAGFDRSGLICALHAAVARRAADPARRAKSAFLANMNHELRTPLNAVLGFSEMICARLHGPIAKEYADYAGYIHASGARLLALIDNLIDMARIEAGNYRLAFGYADLAKIARAALATLADAAAARDVRIEAEIDERLESLRVDGAAARKSIRNVLANAIDFTGRGGRVVLRAGIAGSNVEIAIADEGRGIPPEQIARVLQPFQQGDDSLTREHGGAGLGLSIAKRLMDLQGGTLSIQSKLGVGTTVTLNFPRG
ncbi:MAG: sensor histidine kinase [Alphaproteobacteria bacterium]